MGFGKKGHYDSQDYISVVVGSQFRAIERLTLTRIVSAMLPFKSIRAAHSFENVMMSLTFDRVAAFCADDGVVSAGDEDFIVIFTADD